MPMAAATPYIIPGMIAGAGVSMAQKKDPAKGALYGAGTGGIGAGLIGSTSPQAKALARSKMIKPEPTATTSVISSAAMKAGEMQRRRLRGRRGKATTIFAGRKPLEPAMTAQAGLKQTFG